MDSIQDVNEESFIIKCSGVPPLFFKDKNTVKKYFRRFGKVRYIMFVPRDKCCYVVYLTKEGMQKALVEGGQFNGYTFEINIETKLISKLKKTKKNTDPTWPEDPEIRAELEAMGGIPVARSYNLRPEKMIIDETSLPTPIKSKPKLQLWKNKPKLTKNVTVNHSTFTEENLSNILKIPAFTAEERFKILDARDKLIRIKLKKIELNKVGATVGTCPDMCPEKERLMRENQKQVAIYEQNENGKMNSKLAIKQYSRSSADQESPLPQELRPVSVLQMTMGYLMHQIIGLCETNEVNLGEWYHFLWDRTRGIRKDITQQELCCQGSVELVEQCARFHIFCSARLVNEDPSIFDQKINTENLTKCLQTLKYMYHDLGLKKESCSNEAEFRAYIILLNLNDGNFMWEVQQLRLDIQQSSEIKFALDIYSALDKNNYVKFFKLVKETTYLNACILMRYFIQIRQNAIKTLLKCYSARGAQSQIPVDIIMKILAFEDRNSALEFFEYYGLSSNLEKTQIILDRKNFIQPDYPLVLDRAIKLIENKRTLTVGEVVCGKSLPPKYYENHQPHNSFDENGLLKFDQYFNENDLSNFDVDKITKTEEPDNVGDEEEEDNGVEEEVDEEEEEEVEAEDDDEEEDEYKDNPKDSIPIPLKIGEPIWPPTKPFQFRTSSKDEIDNKSKPSLPILPVIKNDQGFGKLPNNTNIFENKSFVNCNQFSNNFLTFKPLNESPVQPSVSTTIEMKIKTPRKFELSEEDKKEKELKYQNEIQENINKKQKLLEAQEKIKREIEFQQQQIKNELIKSTVQLLIHDLIDSVDLNLFNEKVEQFTTKIQNKKLLKYFIIWKDTTIANKRKRRSMEFSPKLFSNRTLEEEAKELQLPSQNLTLNNIKRYKLGHSLDIDIPKQPEIQKIDLIKLTYDILVQKFIEFNTKLPNEIFWKVTISLPDDNSLFSGLHNLENILNKYLTWGFSNFHVDGRKIYYFVEKHNSNYNSIDSNGIIFIDDDLNDDLLQRIGDIFQNFGLFVKVPIVLLLRKYENNKTKLQLLIDEGIISTYLVLLGDFTNLGDLINYSLIFLAKNIEKNSPLEIDYLNQFLSKHLIYEFWLRINSYSKWNSDFKKCLCDPKIVINLHNTHLNQLKTILMNREYIEYANFPQEFHSLLDPKPILPNNYKYFPQFWKNSNYLKLIEQIINQLKLPNFMNEWPPSNQEKLNLIIKNYCPLISNDSKLYYNVFSILLENIDTEINFSKIKSVNWTQLIKLFALEKLNKINFSLDNTEFKDKSFYHEFVIIYNKQILDNYLQSDWFYINNPIIKERLRTFESKPIQSNILKRKLDNNESVIDLDKILKTLDNNTNNDVKKCRKDMEKCKNMINDLENCFFLEEEILKASKNILNHTMTD